MTIFTISSTPWVSYLPISSSIISNSYDSMIMKIISASTWENSTCIELPVCSINGNTDWVFWYCLFHGIFVHIEVFSSVTKDLSSWSLAYTLDCLVWILGFGNSTILVEEINGIISTSTIASITSVNSTI